MYVIINDVARYKRTGWPGTMEATMKCKILLGRNRENPTKTKHQSCGGKLYRLWLQFRKLYPLLKSPEEVFILMPDNDIFKRKLERIFHKPYNHLRARSPNDVVVHFLLKSLVKKFKKIGGCSVFEQIAALVCDHCHYQPDMLSEVNSPELLVQFQKIETQANGNPITKIAIKQAKSLCLDGTVCVSGMQEAKNLLAERTLKGATDYFFLSPIRYGLIDEFGTLEAVKQWEREEFNSELSLQVTRLAADLAKDPSAQQMKEPRSPHPKRSTKDLLDEPIPTL